MKRKPLEGTRNEQPGSNRRHGGIVRLIKNGFYLGWEVDVKNIYPVFYKTVNVKN